MKNTRYIAGAPIQNHDTGKDRHMEYKRNTGSGSMTDITPPMLLLRNPHMQTILAGLPARRILVKKRAAKYLAGSAVSILTTESGWQLAFSMAKNPDSRHHNKHPGLAVLIHGWAGSIYSNYLVSAASELFNAGFDVLALNLPDHGNSQHLNQNVFHSCRIDMLTEAILAIQQRFKPERLALCGFSLGGNFVLRITSKAMDAGLRIDAAAAVCPVCDPQKTTHAIVRGFPLYHAYYKKKWKDSLLQKRLALQGLKDIDPLLTSNKDLFSMTDYFVEKFTPFESITAYFNGYTITGDTVSRIKTPCSILAAADDPVIPVEDLLNLQKAPNIHINILPWGGHCGFFTDLRLISLADAWITDRLSP